MLAPGRGAAIARPPDSNLSRAGFMSTGFKRPSMRGRCARPASDTSGTSTPLPSSARPIALNAVALGTKQFGRDLARGPPCRAAGSPCAADCPDIVPSDPLTVVRWWSGVRGISRSTYLPCSRRTRLSLRRHCPVPGNRSEHSQQGREPLSTDRRRVRLCGLSRSLSSCRFTIHGLTPNSRFTA